MKHGRFVRVRALGVATGLSALFSIPAVADMAGRWTDYAPSLGVVTCGDYVQSGTTLTRTDCDTGYFESGTISPSGHFSFVAPNSFCPPYPATDLEANVDPSFSEYNGTLEVHATPGTCLYGLVIDVSGVRARCGDYYLDPTRGEQCDDGNNIDGDCCSATCQFENEGASCASDGNVCTDDQCNATGMCVHVNNTVSCDDGNVCTLSDHCSGGTCGGSTLNCDDNDPCTADSCDSVNGCTNDAAPAGGCKMAAKSSLLLKEHGGTGDKMVFKWVMGESLTQAELADPTTAAQYDLCIFGNGGNEVIAAASVPPDNTRWSLLGDRGYKYSDVNGTSAGITRIMLKGHPTQRRSKVLLKGKGLNLPDPILGNLALPVKTQLINRDTGVCLEADFDAASIEQNDSAQFEAKTP